MRPAVNITIFICSLAASILLFSRFDVRRADDEYRRDLTYLHKLYGEKKYDVVLLGDSSVFYGFDPHAFDAFGLEAYNMGLPGLRMTQEALELGARRVKPGGTLLVGITPNMYFDVNQTGLLTRMQEWGRWQYDLYRRAEGIVKLFGLPLRLGRLSKREERSYTYHVEQGWASVSAERHDPSAAAKFHSLQDRTVAHVPLDLPSDIKTVAVVMPISESFREYARSIGFDDSFIAPFDQIESGPWDVRNYDGIHMSIDNARSFSRQLAEKIAERKTIPPPDFPVALSPPADFE